MKGARVTDYGVEALVERKKLPSAFSLERAGIEDIIVFLAKEARHT